MKQRNPFECPYDLDSCDYVDPTTATLDKDCKVCERYGDGVRLTGTTSVFEWLIKKFKRKRAMFECPYDLESCSHVDTLSMTKDTECESCDRYGDGVRPTGGILFSPDWVKKNILKVK